MPQETGRFIIDGDDAFDHYGLVFLPGTYNELLRLPEAKAGYFNNWPDEDGIERIITAPKFEALTYNIPVCHWGSDKTDFFEKYNRLCTFLLTAGYFELDAVNIDRRYTLFYQRIQSVEKLSLIDNSQGDILVKSTLTLANDFPLPRSISSTAPSAPTGGVVNSGSHTFTFTKAAGSAPPAPSSGIVNSGSHTFTFTKSA